MERKAETLERERNTMESSENLFFWHESGIYRHFSEKLWWPLKSISTRSVIFFSIVIFIGAFISAGWIDTSITQNLINTSRTLRLHSHNIPKRSKTLEFPLNCFAGNLTNTCPTNYPTTFKTDDHDSSSSPPTCPDYFRWIHEDLRPWRHTGISKEMVERANSTANFRLVIVKGKVYIEKYRDAFQTRDVFTLWGILQLLRRYPQLPDLELMFDCVDWPVIKSSDYGDSNEIVPPPLFRYCGDNSTLDIVFPDWSFWGWAEVSIKPWEALLKELKEGNERSKWIEREPFAYWKGNPDVAETRKDLLKCNATDKQDWNAHLYAQDWIREYQEGYKKSNLASQCTHRYKIYIEGSAWSVSKKYILACDSVTLLVKPHYYDFFTRSLMPVQHYWPIREDDKCKSIKFAVDWGNSHKQKAQAIGKAASNFIQEELKMDYVYDYMFHLLNEYAKLFRYKPSIPQNAVELCSETMACPANGLEKKFMMESMEKGPSVTSPCAMPSPFDRAAFQTFVRKKENSIKQVEIWEKKYWDSINREP